MSGTSRRLPSTSTSAARAIWSRETFHWRAVAQAVRALARHVPSATQPGGTARLQPLPGHRHGREHDAILGNLGAANDGGIRVVASNGLTKMAHLLVWSVRSPDGGPLAAPGRVASFRDGKMVRVLDMVPKLCRRPRCGPSLARLRSKLRLVASVRCSLVPVLHVAN